jgi:hypothetical protein
MDGYGEHANKADERNPMEGLPYYRFHGFFLSGISVIIGLGLAKRKGVPEVNSPSCSIRWRGIDTTEERSGRP